MSEIKIGTGNGQGSCYGCEQKGKWNRSWVNFLYEYEDKLWCEDCLIARLHKENQELKKQLNEKIILVMNLKEELEDKRKEYQEVYKDVRTEIKDYKNQQKEFIEWLENWLKILKEQFKGMRGVNAAYQKLIIDTVNETLSKYKEIIGGDNK